MGRSKLVLETSPPIENSLSDDVLPERADVVVIGGGIVGSCVALFLAEQGVNTALCEKGVIGGEQSGRNLGWCRSAGRHRSETLLGAASLELWRGMNERIGADTGFRQSGRLFLCESDLDVELQEKLCAEALSVGVQVRRLNDREASRLLPGSENGWKAVFHAPSDGRAEPEKAAPVIVEAARKRGAKVLTNCAVRGLEMKHGRISAVVTEKGTIECDRVVLAAGAWTSVFCRNVGVRFPLLQIAGSVMRTVPLEGGPEESIGSSKFGIRRHIDGSFSLSPFVATLSLGPSAFRFARDFLPNFRSQTRSLRYRFGKAAIKEWAMPTSWRNNEPSPFENTRSINYPPFADALKRVRVQAGAVVPLLSHAKISHNWSGIIDVSPDQVPTIDRVTSIPGLWIGAGFSGHGFGLGPGAARLLADMVTDRAPIVDPAPFRMDRFKQ